MIEEVSPWICHVCERTFTTSEGVVCSACFTLSCRSHMITATVLNRKSGLYELVQICTDCRIRQQL